MDMGTKKRTELIFDVVCLLAGVVLFVNALSIDTGTTMGQGADFMPKLCALLWIVVSVGQLLHTLKAEDDHEKKLDINLRSFFSTIVLLLAYILLLPILGFIASSMVYLIAQMLLFVPTVYRTRKNIILFIVLALIVPIATYFLFVNAFGLLLPSGIIFG